MLYLYTIVIRTLAQGDLLLIFHQIIDSVFEVCPMSHSDQTQYEVESTIDHHFRTDILYLQKLSAPALNAAS